ncbi:MAG: hypothetical protein CL403_06585 [Acidimicrobiaceae bacterium]|nr:hypothetical protein [Acidimicrobiaceae bacterium]HAI64892.1 hypothetical protein [Acidimicrobiaceae bacterium]
MGRRAVGAPIPPRVQFSAPSCRDRRRGARRPSGRRTPVSAAAQITLSAVALGITFWVVRLVGLRQLRSKYALLWLVITVPLVPLAVFPAIVDEAGEFLGVNYAPALLFSFSSLLLLGIVIHYSWELSRLESRTRRLGEEIALLNERLNDAERADDGEDES